MIKKVIFEGKETNYSVSDDGRIYNDKTGRELKGTLARNDYRSVQLTIEGHLKTFMVHRLVAEAFCENPNNCTIVDHIDRDKTNCNASNLRWVSNKENSLNVGIKKAPTKIKEYINLADEEVADLLDFDNYIATKSGKIARKDTLAILKGGIRNGYVRICIKNRNYSAHKLIYEAFNGPIPEDLVVDHIDGNRANNALSNLRIITQKENIKNSYTTNRKGMAGLTNFTPEGKKLKHYNTIQEAADEYGVTHAAIKAAANYGTKSCGFYWLRDDSISTEKEFVSTMPDTASSFKGMTKTKISDTGLLYSASSRHLIPQYEDEKGKYWFISSKDGGYVKFYENEP